jgi:hypothetical protein
MEGDFGRTEGEEDRKCAVEVVSAKRAFNLPLYEVYFVIDCRQASKFIVGHIASALNFPPPVARSERHQSLAEFANYASDNFCNDRWDPIVLYGDDDEEVVAHMQWVVAKLLEFAGTSPPDGMENWFIQCICKKARNIWIIEGGYEGFVKEYPLLTFTPVQPFDTGASSMKPLPYHVSSEGDGVFLGSRAVEWSKDLIEGMGIRAVVLDTVAGKKFDSASCVEPLECFLCSLSNDDDALDEKVTVWEPNRMEMLFEYATEFIQNAVLNNRRVLIQLQGRSASAAIAIAWTMRYQHKSFEEARAALFSCTLRDPTDATSSVLDKTLLLEKELRLWEKSARFAAL